MLVALLVAGLVGGGYALFFSGGVSKEDFIEQAEDICSETREQERAIDPGDPTAPGALARFYEANLELLERQTTRIKELELPEEDRQLLDEWLSTQEQLAQAFEDLVEAAANGDQAGVDAAFTETAGLQAQSTELATRYGFTSCGIASPE